MADDTLAHTRVLLVEDDALIGLDIAQTLEAAGATVIGPLDTLEAARAAACGEAVDLAVLDIDLRGEEVFPAAARLRARGIPFLFYTGRPDRAALREVYPDIPVCVKPLGSRQLLAAVSGLRTLEVLHI